MRKHLTYVFLSERKIHIHRLCFRFHNPAQNSGLEELITYCSSGQSGPTKLFAIISPFWAQKGQVRGENIRNGKMKIFKIFILKHGLKDSTFFSIYFTLVIFDQKVGVFYYSMRELIGIYSISKEWYYDNLARYYAIRLGSFEDEENIGIKSDYGRRSIILITIWKRSGNYLRFAFSFLPGSRNGKGTSLNHFEC